MLASAAGPHQLREKYDDVARTNPFAFACNTLKAGSEGGDCVPVRWPPKRSQGRPASDVDCMQARTTRRAQRLSGVVSGKSNLIDIIALHRLAFVVLHSDSQASDNNHS